MAKEKKITIKHYLNDKVKPQAIPYNWENNKTHPVYTLITYNRQSNNIAFDWNFGFYGIDIDKFDSLFIKKEKIHFNKKIEELEAIIKDSIRYEAKKDEESMSLKGFAQRIIKYQAHICRILNFYVYMDVLDFLQDYLIVRKYNQLLDGKGIDIYHGQGEFYSDFSKINSLMPNFLEKIDLDLRSKITLLVHYLYFENTRGEFYWPDRHFIQKKEHCIHWINGSIKEQFIAYLRAKVNGEAIKIKDEVNMDIEDIINLINIFPLEKKSLSKYISMIDKMVNDFLEKDYRFYPK